MKKTMKQVKEEFIKSNPQYKSWQVTIFTYKGQQTPVVNQGMNGNFPFRQGKKNSDIFEVAK